MLQNCYKQILQNTRNLYLSHKARSGSSNHHDLMVISLKNYFTVLLVNLAQLQQKGFWSVFQLSFFFLIKVSLFFNLQILAIVMIVLDYYPSCFRCTWICLMFPNCIQFHVISSKNSCIWSSSLPSIFVRSLDIRCISTDPSP